MDLRHSSGDHVPNKVYSTTAEGITSTYSSPNSKRCPHLVSRRILPPGNHNDMSFPQALVVACAIQVSS